MLPLWILRRQCVVALLLWLFYSSLSHAVEAPASPSLSGNKNGATIDLHWSIDCSVTTVNIQESTDGSTWNSVYSGLGSPDEGTAPPILMAFSFGGGSGTYCPDWTSARYTNLPSRSLSGYYYRINACIGTACSAYSNSTLIGSPSTPAAPWRNLSPIAVSDVGGNDAAPAEIVDLSAAAVKGQAGVTGGQAGYQIPIDLPPGRNGVQPSISLSYNSQSGNGLLGMGWSLNAGSSISRCGATNAQDGFTKAVTFNATTDRLCLDGQRLIAVSGTYGVSGAEYRTEMDSFIKVVQSGNINASSTSFTAFRPNGSIAYYGGSANSRFVPGSLTTALTWKLSQESFSNGANTIDYEYDTSVVGEHLLRRIRYTGSQGQLGERRVDFEYETRDDARISYMYKGLMQSQRRLKRVVTFVSDIQQLTEYNLAYQVSRGTRRSLLKEIELCSSVNSIKQCSPLTTLNWLDTIHYGAPEPLTFSGQEVYKNQKVIESSIPYGDIDGNGTSDFPGYNVDAEQNIVTTNALALNTSCRFMQESLRYDCAQADFDFDGKIDPYRIINGFMEINFSTSSAGYQKTSIKIVPSIGYTFAGDRIISIVDMNGDNKPDVVLYRHNKGKALLEIYLHTGSLSVPYGNPIIAHQYTYDVVTPNIEWAPKQTIDVVGDIDGDGLIDLKISSVPRAAMGQVFPGNGSFLLNRSTSTTLSFVPASAPSKTSIVGNMRWDFTFNMDVNGDGLIDLLGWNNGIFAVSLNQGGGQFKAWQNIANDKFFPSFSATYLGLRGEYVDVELPGQFNSFYAFDYNGDGVSEFLVPGEAIIRDPDNNWGGLVDEMLERSKGDDTIYRYDAIYFDLQPDGSFWARREPTNIIASATQTAFVDAFGDGNVDVIFNYGNRGSGTPLGSKAPYFNGNYGAYIVRNYGAGTGNTTSDYQPVDYLDSVVDGLGNTSTWRYRPMSTGEQSAIDTSAECNEPNNISPFYCTDNTSINDGYVHFASSMYVVQSFKQSNGQSGENETQYAYKGAMYNMQGRGFTGFNQIWEKDMQRDKTVHSVFKQKFPEVGLLTEQTVSVGSTTVNQVTNTWADNPQHTISGVYHNIQTRSLQQSWDLQGIALSTQEVQVNASDVDSSGNIKKQTQTVTDYIKGQANTYASVAETGFVPDVNNWWLNKFNWIKTSHSTAQRNWGDDPVGTMDKAQWQLQTVNTWDSNHKLPTKVTYTASNSSCNRVEETGLNSYGLPLWTKTTGQSSTCIAMAARQTSFTYTKDGTTQADDGYLPYKVTNAKGHITTTEYDMGLGLPSKVIAPNSIVTQTEFDGIGRPVQVKQTGSPTRYLRYLLANEGNNPPQNNDNIPVVMTRTSGAGMPETEQYFDGQGRLLRTATQGFDGGYQYQDKHYDALGHLTRESTPYGNGTAADYTEFSDFDALDRPGRRTIPNGRSGGLESLYTYNGLTTDINVEGRLMSRTYGSQGWLYETVDAQNGTNRFAYDSGGRPLVIRDANNSDIKATYNGFGHKTQVIDPNQGATVFGYNSVGELDKQTDANGVVQTYVLDVLGRVTSKTTTGGSAPGTATFVWDTLKQGLLTSETENGVARTYAYTTALQLAQTTVTVDGVSRTVKHQYDGFYGRPKALEYPNGLTLKYSYNDYGYLEQTSNAASGYLYRQVTAMDEAGHITGAELGNRVMSESRSYYSEGTMASVEVDGPLGRIHAHYYDGYDEFMNLTSERDGVTGLTKSYRYDTLNRLTEYQFSNSNPTFSATVNYAYDKVGNFLKKTDYSANSSTAYRYGGSACGYKPNAVCQLDKLNGTTVSFQYDNRGNLRVGDGLTMTYNAMDKPLSVSGRGATTSFVYGSDNMRAKQSRTVGSATTTTYYVDKYYEADSDGSWRAYLDDIAVLSYTSQRGHLLQFTLKDRLGSATTLADQNGNIVSQRYFDPFGRTASTGGGHRTDIVNKNTLQSKLQDLDITNKNRRGFTDHEHLNEQQLIHMNGRIYDYNLGRFMSVDPFIQSPTSTQSVNPYSYIMNNPLAGTDPTGYCSTGTHIKGNDAAGCSVAFDAGSLSKAQVGAAKAMAVTSAGASAKVNGATTQQTSIIKELAGAIHDAGGLANLAKQVSSSPSQEHNQGGISDTFRGYIKGLGQSFLDNQAQALAGGLGINDTESIQSSIQIPITESESLGAELARSSVANAGMVTSSVAMIANLRNAEFSPDKNLIMGSLSLLVIDGKIDVSMLKTFVPEGVRNTFGPTDDIPAGQKYQFKIGDTRISLKWHSPHARAQILHPGSNSGSMWTAQIQVGKKFLTTSGSWVAQPKRNDTHIPIIR